MKIVKFKDGNYAIRRFSLLYLTYVYKDLKHLRFWWERSDSPYRDSRSTDLEEVKAMYSLLTDRGEIYKEPK